MKFLNTDKLKKKFFVCSGTDAYTMLFITVGV